MDTTFGFRSFIKLMIIISKFLNKQGRKRPLDTPKRMIERRERYRERGERDREETGKER